jgi:site-specific recombinase XerD
MPPPPVKPHHLGISGWGLTGPGGGLLPIARLRAAARSRAEVSVKILSAEQLQRLIEAVPERAPFGVRDRAMMKLAYGAGLRVSELTSLNVGQVWSGKRPRDWLELPGSACKGGRGRGLPLGPVAQQAVAELIAFQRQRGFSVESEAPLLTTRQHQRLPAREVQRAVQRYREGAEVAATPHTLRHTFASRLTAAGVGLRAVQHLLGHQSIRTTEVYLHSQPSELVAAVAKL